MSSPKTKLEEEVEENCCSKRLKRRHDGIKCLIELENGLIKRETIGSLVCEICKYLLYDRQQIPFPLSNSQSLKQLNDKSIETKLNRKEELILLMINDLNQLFDELICIMNEISIDCICLSLGQTLQMPKELYRIQINHNIYNDKHSVNCKTISLKQMVTRFFKTILNDGNILFQSRKDIPITKMFLIFKLKRSDVTLLMEHSKRSHSISDESEQLFTPLLGYEMPIIGNRFYFNIEQKQCDCCLVSNPHDFQIYDENNVIKNDSNYIEKELTQTMSGLLSLNDLSLNKSNKCEDFIWIQIRSSIKGVQYNIANKDQLLSY